MLQEKEYSGATPVTAANVAKTAGIVIGSVACFIAASIIGSIICRNAEITGYKAQFLSGIISLVFYVVILVLLKKTKVLTTKGNGFFGGLFTGGFMIYASIAAVISSLFLSSEDGKTEFIIPKDLTFGSEQVWCILALTLAAGVCEELLFRGIIFNTLRDLFGRDTEKGTIAAIVTSGVLFGLYHLLNLVSGVDISAVLPQVASTAALGIFLAAVYARWGNIWVTVFLHALMDICVVLPNSMKTNENIVESINNTMADNSKYLGVIIYIILAVILLRKDKRPQMFTYSVCDDR
jgi:hypothetical protein